MSKRAGNFITMREVLDKVGKGVVRFIMLTRKADAVIDFDLKKVLETTKENPVFYVQYANARICSALRAATEQGISSNDNDDMSVLTHPAELDAYPQTSGISANSALNLRPYTWNLTVYRSICMIWPAEFHQLWNIACR
jgi:cysteinyl-tRNA synthetase